MKIIRTLLALLGATILLGALAGAASARNFSISSQLLRGTWRSVEYVIPGATARCQLTLEGSFHSRTAPKVIGSLVGYITSAILGPCASGVATILRETLPWHSRYSGFEGTLPNISSIIGHAANVSARIREAGGITCLYRSTASEPAIISLHRSTVTQEITEAGLTGRIRTGIECFGAAGVITSDSGQIMVQNSSTRITLSLI